MYSLSIIIVTYNSENEIKECLDSLLIALSEIDYEILITDNNSSDSTLSKINELELDKIRVIKNDENFGFTRAVNQCFELVTKKYVLLLNPDTIVGVDTLSALIEGIEGDDSISVIAPQLRYPDGNIQKSCRRFPKRRDIIYELICFSRLFSNSKEFNSWKMGDFDHKTSSFVDQPAGAALLFPKSIFNEVGYLDETFPMFFSDVDYCKRIMDSGYKIKYSVDTYITHKGGTSIYNNRKKMIVSSHISFFKYFVKHKKGFLNFIMNILTGGLLLFLIPIRILLNLIFPSLKYRQKNTL